MERLLSIENLTARYGQITALSGLSLDVRPGEAVALVGANGAGKSTLMKCIMGLVRSADGRIAFQGTDLSSRRISDRPHLGIGYSPEGRRVFPGLTVRENLQVANHDSAAEKTRLAEIFRMFPALEEKQHALGWQLSGGQQQMLAIGRALMLKPKLLLLDEPSLGLSPLLTAEVLNRVRDIVAAGTSVLLAEQNVHKALAICDRAYVLRLGQVIDQGPCAQLLANDRVKAAFLGA